MPSCIPTCRLCKDPTCSAPRPWGSRHPCLPLVQGGTATCPPSPSPSQTSSQSRLAANPAAGPAPGPALCPRDLGEPCAISHSLAPPTRHPLSGPRPEGSHRAGSCHAHPRQTPIPQPVLGLGWGQALQHPPPGPHPGGLRVLAPIQHGSTPALTPRRQLHCQPCSRWGVGKGPGVAAGARPHPRPGPGASGWQSMAVIHCRSARTAPASSMRRERKLATVCFLWSPRDGSGGPKGDGPIETCSQASV